MLQLPVQHHLSNKKSSVIRFKHVRMRSININRFLVSLIQGTSHDFSESTLNMTMPESNLVKFGFQLPNCTLVDHNLVSLVLHVPKVQDHCLDHQEELPFHARIAQHLAKRASPSLLR